MDSRFPSFLVFALVCLCHLAAAGVGGPWDTPLDVTPPNLPAGTVELITVPGPFFQDFQRPFPTNSWWQAFTVKDQTGRAGGPFPFHSQTLNTGLAFGVAEIRSMEGRSIHQRPSLDWRASFTGLPETVTNRKATGWDRQTLCLMYFSGVTLGIMQTCLVPGSPYMTLSYSNAAPVLTSQKGTITNFQYIVPGKKATMTNGGGTYLIWVVGGASLTLVQEGNTVLQAAAPFTGTIRVAKLVSASQEAVLDAHVETVPTGMTMSYTVSGDVAEQLWEWQVAEGGDPANLLLLNWPHHRKHLVNPVQVDTEYMTIKGRMVGVVGNRWTQRHALPTISWFAALDPHPSCMPELVRTLEAEVRQLSLGAPGDFYFWGGSFARVSQLATIAEHVGRRDLVTPIVDVLKRSVEYWFDPNHPPGAAYETGWGGFVNARGFNNTNVDFGNTYYNDHHFHYGYLLHGAAVIGKYDPAWLRQHLAFFMQCARNTGNPSPNDPHYTVTRNMDFFAGHSWASGVANSASTRDQESSGEAVNGYYGLLLFAHAINNTALVDWSRLLLATEITGAQSYWHLYPTAGPNDTPYPEQEIRDFVTIGVVRDTEAGAWLYWGSRKIQIAAIQMLPLTPIGAYNYDVAWMEQVLPYCHEELDDPSIGDSLKSVIHAAYSEVNPQVAFNGSQELFDWGSGNSATNTLYYIATRPPPSGGGDICRAGVATPEGVFRMQHVQSGRYVTLAGSTLTAVGGVEALATKFELEFVPGGSTILALNNAKYVTAGTSGTSALSAAREAPRSQEVFRWKIQADGSYQLVAMANRQEVGVTESGSLVNNGETATFTLSPTGGTPPAPLPALGVLKNIATGRYVVVPAAEGGGSTNLFANTSSAAIATRFEFERVEGFPDTAPVYAFKTTATTTDRYVTSNTSGTQALQASKASAASYERFQFIPYEGGYILIHMVTGQAVTVQPDETLVDNGSGIEATALWAIESSA